MNVTPLSPLGGVAVKGVDLSRPQSLLESRALSDLYDEQGLVVFHGQTLSKRELIAAALPFGGAMIEVSATAPDPEVPGILVVSTRGATGDVVPDDPVALVGDLEWHTDQGHVPNPSRGKILYAVQVPAEGGLTGFIDGHATYSALTEDMKRQLENLHVIQSWNRAETYLARNRAYRVGGDTVLHNQYKDVAYPMIVAHPVTKRKVLNVPPLWSAGVVELPGTEGIALIEELVAHVKQQKFQYWHRYQPGDALIWDNWRFVHAAGGTPGRYARTLWGVMLAPTHMIGCPLETAGL
jgi:taurine dioxygenase